MEEGDSSINEELLQGNDAEQSKKRKPEKSLRETISMPSEEGIRYATFITERKSTIIELDAIAQKLKLIFIRAPPYSGKTSLCELLRRWYVSNASPPTNVFSLTALGYRDFQKFWEVQTGKGWEHWFFESREETVIIIDELQIFYNQEEARPFFEILKDLQNNRLKYPHLKLFLFAAYGDVVPTLGTPVQFYPAFGSRIMYFNADEAKELFDNFQGLNPHLTLTPSIRSYLFELTEGHVGLISISLKALRKHYQKATHEITESKILQYYLSFHYESSLGSTRASFGFSDLKEDSLEVLHDFLQNPEQRISLMIKKKKEIVIDLIKRAILGFQDKGKEQNFERDSDVITFSNPLFHRMAMVRFCNSSRPDRGYDHLHDFMLACLGRLSPRFLENSMGRTSSTTLNNANAPLERTWQMEIYRAATACLPTTDYISPDVGKGFPGVRGLADFYVNDKRKWVIEIIREGQDMKSHWERFQEGGIYHKLNPNDWLILDFRTDSKQIYFHKYEKIWHVCYNSDFSGATIKRQTPTHLETIATIKFLGDQFPPNIASLPPKATFSPSLETLLAEGKITSELYEKEKELERQEKERERQEREREIERQEREKELERQEREREIERQEREKELERQEREKEQQRREQIVTYLKEQLSNPSLSDEERKQYKSRLEELLFGKF